MTTITTALTAPLFMQIGRKRYQVATVADASRLFSAARDRSGMGASQLHQPLLTDENGKVFGYVSYNGRVWVGHPRDWHSDTPLLFDNRALVSA